MGFQHVTVGSLRAGLPVEYLGTEPERVGVLDDELVARGVALYPGHPGRVWRTAPQHVQVTWIGPEQEPASYAIGFSTESSLASDASYPGLGRLSEEEFVRRERFLRERFVEARDLSDWVPVWPAHT